ncbi:MAG: S8 family serine peptidase, partial [Pirellulales bacterium]|nr:S8 family serine peptidase [Pirellulales bacterium]
MEPLEERFYLSASSVFPLVSADWFTDVSDSNIARHVNPDSLSSNDVEELDKLISIDGDSVKEFDWIVRFDTDALDGISSVAETTSLLVGQGIEFEVLRGLGLAGQVVVRSYGSSASEVADWFSSSTCVADYELDLCYQMQTVPNDSSYSSLWGMNNANGADIDAEAAWDISTGSSSIVVAVIDTGVDYTHPDLAANIWTNPGEIAGNGIDDDGNGFVDDVHGYDFCNDDGDPMDDHNHGTHCAGTIAGVGNNGLGVTGVNWNSSIMALKFLSSTGSGSLSDAVMAINYATMMRVDYGVNVRVSNNSWGGGGFSSSMNDAITAHNDAGILFVAAAGNDGTNNDITAHYPSSYSQSGVIAVAATTRYDELAYFSNYGATTVDLAAPGMSIYSTIAGGGYDTFSGTSMATPHVAGVAALAWSVAPDATVIDIREAILQGVDPLAELSGKMTTGGRLNALNTLEFLLSTDPTAPYMADLSASPNPASLGATVTITATGLTDADGNVTAVSFYLDSNGDGQYDENDTLIGTDNTIVDSSASIAYDTGGLEGGNHRIFARALDNDSQWSRAYSTTLTLTTPDQHGDTYSTATLIAVGSSTNGEIQTTSDVDWFKFEAHRDWLYVIDTDLVTLSDSVLYLYDQDGTTLLELNDDVSWPADPSSIITWQAPTDGTYFVKVTNYATETGTYRLNLQGSDTLSAIPQDLGIVDFEDIDGIDLTAGGISYALETSREGYITIEALFEGNSENVTITLHDLDMNTLATSSACDGGQRIDYQAASGEILFIDITGNVDDVDLTIANLVRESDNRVYVYGTALNDSFDFTAAAMHEVTVNGLSYEFDPASFDRVQFHGEGGTDMVMLTGNSGDDTASISPTFGSMTGTGYQVIVADMEIITANGGGGNDMAMVYDSEVRDYLVTTPEYTLMYSDAYANRVESFASVEAFSLSGGSDKAWFYDSAGDDTFVGTATDARMSGNGFDNHATGFRYNYAMSEAGGNDTANFYDSVGDDRLFMYTPYVKMYCDDYLNLATGFRYNYAYSEAGGTDKVWFNDTAGDDTFVGTGTDAQMYGEGYANLATGFRYNYALSANGGVDTAHFYDSAGDDRLFMYTPYVKMYCDNYLNLATGFRYNYAYSEAGGKDKVWFNDTAGDDTFVGTGTNAQMYGEGYTNLATGFRYNYALS